MKIIGIGICFAIMLGAILQIGHHLFIDINSALFVLGGATGFLVFKKSSGDHIKNFGQGAVYFGWLGTLVGLIAITGNRFMVWGDVEKMGPALAVALLTLLYGYIIKIVTIAFTERLIGIYKIHLIGNVWFGQWGHHSTPIAKKPFVAAILFTEL